MKELRLSRKDKVVLGVLGGIAEYLGISSTVLRLVFIVALILGIGTPVFAYMIAWLVILTIGGKEEEIDE